MTIASLLLGTAVSQVVFVLTKVIFLHYLNIDSIYILILFFVALIIETIAVVRRMGTLNYVESFFLAVVWFVTILIIDYIVTATLIGSDLFSSFAYWMTYVAIILAVIIFHKKMHVQVRRATSK